MSGIDLGNPKGFAKATQATFGPTAELLSLFSGGIEDWDIQEASYVSNSSQDRGVEATVFHVFESKQNYSAGLSEVEDSGGRRKITYMFPYKDGQTTDDLGRSAETISMNVIIHGPNYLSAYKKLFRELNKPEPGILIHPIRGAIECVLDEYTVTHKSETRQAMTISLQFMEHNFTVGDLANLTDDVSVKSALSRALQVFEDINTAILNVTGAVIFAQTFKNKLLAALDGYKNGYTDILGKMNKTFNANGSSNDIPGLVPVNEGGLIDGDGNRVGDTFTIAQSPNDPFANVPVESLDPDTIAAISVLQLEQETNEKRQDLEDLLNVYKEDTSGQAELEFNQDIINLKASALAIQEVLEAGKSSSRTTIVNYVIPSTMSLREATYRNGVSLDRLGEIEILNPDLVSVNFLEKGLTLRIPK